MRLKLCSFPFSQLFQKPPNFKYVAAQCPLVYTVCVHACEKVCKNVTERKKTFERRLLSQWQDNKLLNSVPRTGEGDRDSEVTEGCQECCSVWDITSKPNRTDKNSCD